MLYLDIGREVIVLADEKTSKRVASIASKILRNPNASKSAKSAAGSALTQRPNKKSRY
jgi:hypothetical protein